MMIQLDKDIDNYYLCGIGIMMLKHIQQLINNANTVDIVDIGQSLQKILSASQDIKKLLVRLEIFLIQQQISLPEKLTYKEFYDVMRDHLKDESTLFNTRINAFLASQAFLAIAFVNLLNRI